MNPMGMKPVAFMSTPQVNTVALIVVGVWVFLQAYLLPKIGVST